MLQYLFTTKQNKMTSFILILVLLLLIIFFISVKGIKALNVLFVSGKFNFANDSVYFRLDLSLGLKGDDVIKHMTWANCFYLCSFRTVQFTYYRYLNYSFWVGHRQFSACMFLLTEALALEVKWFDVKA